jgi:hypothetical protein
MRIRVIALPLLLSLASISGAASAKGCIKGAVVGGVVGHVAGKHGAVGAAAGCAIGHHKASKKDKEAAAQNNAAPVPAQPAPAAK